MGVCGCSAGGKETKDQGRTIIIRYFFRGFEVLFFLGHIFLMLPAKIKLKHLNHVAVPRDCSSIVAAHGTVVPCQQHRIQP